MVQEPLLEPKVQKLIFADLDALELAVALVHPTVALSGHSNQVFFTTNKATHFILFANRSPYLGDGSRTIA